MNSPIDRRNFLGAVTAAGFAAAVQPICAQTLIQTDASNLHTEMLTIKSGGQDLPIYVARPIGKVKFPVVLVIQEIFGVHEHIKDICRRLAKLGYMAVAPELYFRQGDPSKITDIKILLSDIVGKVPDQQVLADLDACVAWADKHQGDAARLGITGFCWGGRITWLYAAHNPKVEAAVAWYGRLVGDKSELTPEHPLGLASNMHGALLGLYGGADSGIPVDTVEKMRQALKDAGKKADLIIYPDTPHAFNADYRPSYRKEAADDGWKRLTAWFADNLK